MNKVKVSITFEWEFDWKEWDESLKHREEMLKSAQVKLGYDAIHGFFMLNNIKNPIVKEVKIE